MRLAILICIQILSGSSAVYASRNQGPDQSQLERQYNTATKRYFLGEATAFGSDKDPNTAVICKDEFSGLYKVLKAERADRSQTPLSCKYADKIIERPSAQPGSYSQPRP